ncbi:hypothetical protein TNCT_219241 [Trichonephila clavata]|uniref:Uncharacterized protein n=1 Tax=Trichonephila clavata TaxID=2740835 RepID=A0A8X6GN63_TRICU|nr:hypothetical protein TNCT_219241 [Trichonephila clavata]
MLSAQIRSISYETVERRYLSNLRTNVYIDGSTIGGTGAGAGVYCNHFPKSNFPRHVILSDSKAALQAIFNNTACTSERI